LAAQHNYIDRDEAQMILDNLNKKPFFKENPVTFDDIDGETSLESCKEESSLLLA